MLKLQRALKDHLLQQAQCLLPEDQQCPQASRKREKRIGQLLSQTVNLIWSEAIKKLKFKDSLPYLDSGCSIRAGQQTLSRPDEPSPWLGGFEAAFVSHVLSSRGTGISDFYHFNFQSAEAYQTDTYHKDENPSVRWGHPWKPQPLGFAESCAKCCVFTFLSIMVESQSG